MQEKVVIRKALTFLIDLNEETNVEEKAKTDDSYLWPRIQGVRKKRNAQGNWRYSIVDTEIQKKKKGLRRRKNKIIY